MRAGSQRRLSGLQASGRGGLKSKGNLARVNRSAPAQFAGSGDICCKFQLVYRPEFRAETQKYFGQGKILYFDFGDTDLLTLCTGLLGLALPIHNFCVSGKLAANEVTFYLRNGDFLWIKREFARGGRIARQKIAVQPRQAAEIEFAVGRKRLRRPRADAVE